MFVWAGGALVSGEGHLRTPSRESQPGFSAWRWRGAGTGRKAAWPALSQLRSGQKHRAEGKKGTRNLDWGFNGKRYEITQDLSDVINYINYYPAPEFLTFLQAFNRTAS